MELFFFGGGGQPSPSSPFTVSVSVAPAWRQIRMRGEVVATGPGGATQRHLHKGETPSDGVLRQRDLNRFSKIRSDKFQNTKMVQNFNNFIAHTTKNMYTFCRTFCIKMNSYLQNKRDGFGSEHLPGGSERVSLRRVLPSPAKHASPTWAAAPQALRAPSVALLVGPQNSLPLPRENATQKLLNFHSAPAVPVQQNNVVPEISAEHFLSAYT